jgi:DNA-binding response OmpR family regulator
MKILLVDDAPDVVEAVRLGMLLLWRDVEVLDAGTGSVALDLVESETPDLVLLDIGLPEMNGFDVLREIRAFSDVPVIMLTARDSTIDTVKGLELGADDYVTKPFDHLELLARIQAVLRSGFLRPGSACRWRAAGSHAHRVQAALSSGA